MWTSGGRAEISSSAGSTVYAGARYAVHRIRLSSNAVLSASAPRPACPSLEGTWTGRRQSGLRTRDPTVLRKLAASRQASRLADLLPDLNPWLPVVRKLSPGHAWPDVTAAVNVAQPASHRRFTMDRLVSAVRLLVAEGLAERELLDTAPRRPSRRELAGQKRATEVAAVLVAGRTAITLAQVGIELTRLGLAPPRGGSQWGQSTARPGARAGLVVPP
jgi:hypothetical protein